MLDLAPGGFEEADRGSTIEFAVYADAASAAVVGSSFSNVTATLVAPGWAERWREFHHAVRAGGLWIGPPWESPTAGEPAVVIDPGRAFGTGSHATTRACVELLAQQPRGRVLDVGCGSGVIAIAAVRLGFDRVFAVDVDPVAVEVTRENAARNGVEVDVRELDARHSSLPHADIVVANIELATVESLLARGPASRAITSGYLAGQAPAVQGWTCVDHLELDGWSADVLEAENDAGRGVSS